MKKVGNIFVRFGQWIKATAWIQVIGIVGIVVGIIVAVPYIVRGFQGWIATFDDSTFYNDNRINNEKYQELVSGSSEKNIIVYFYEDTCAHCQTDQKFVESFYNDFHDDEKTAFDFYSMNVAWEDEENDNDVTKDQLGDIGPILFEVYRGQTDEKILGNYTNMSDETVTNLNDPYSFPTPTIALIKDGGVHTVRLGFDSDDYDGVSSGLYYMLTGTDL